MEFVTIHDLSRQFNISSRVVRYRLKKLIAESKLKEPEDFIRDQYIDEQHFFWKINPLSFMRETGLQRVTPPPKMDLPVNHVGNNTAPSANQMGNTSAELDNNTSNQLSGAMNPPPQSTNPPANHSSTTVNQSPASVANVVTQTDDNTKAREEDRAFEREMIDFLKDQIRVKDELIKEQGRQLTDSHRLNQNLNGALLEQGKKIENLLRLTGGRMDDAEAEGNARPPAGDDLKQAA